MAIPGGNNLGSINVGATFDASAFTTGINKAISELTRFTRSTNKLSDTIERDFTKTASDLGLKIQAALMKGFVFGKSPTKEITSIMRADITELSSMLGSLGSNMKVSPLVKQFEQIRSQILATRKEMAEANADIAKWAPRQEVLRQRLTSTQGGIAIPSRADGELAEDYKKRVNRTVSNQSKFAQLGPAVLEKIDAKVTEAKKNLTGYQEQMNSLATSLKGVATALKAEDLKVLQTSTKQLVYENERLGGSYLDNKKKADNYKQILSNLQEQHKSITGYSEKERTARVKLSEQYVATEKQLKAVNKELGVFATGGRRAGMAIQDLIKWQAEWYLTQGLLFGAVNYFKIAISNIVEFEQRLANLKAITGSTTKETEAMGKAARELGTHSRFSAIEIADGMTILGQAGFNARETIEAMKSAVALSTSTLTDMKVTVDLLTTAIRVYNKDASEAPDVANVMAAATNYSKLTMEGLATAFNYVGATGAQAGLEMNELTAAMGVMADRGIKFSTIGTSLRGILGSLISPSDRFKKSIEAVGLTMDQVNPLTTDLGTILTRLRDRGFSVEAAYKGLDKRVAGGILTLIQSADSYKTLTMRLKDTNAAFEMQSIQLDTVQSAWLLFKNNIIELGLKLGTAILPILNAVVVPLQGIFSAINGVSSAISEVNSTFASGVGYVVQLATSVAVLTGTFATTTTIIWPFVKSILGLNDALTITGAIVKSFDRITDWMKSKMGIWTIAITAVLTAIGMLMKYLSDLKKEALETFKTAETGIRTLNDLEAALKKQGLTTQELGSIVDQLTTAYPQLKGQVDLYKRSIDATTEAVRLLREEQIKTMLLNFPQKLKELESQILVASGVSRSHQFIAGLFSEEGYQKTIDYNKLLAEIDIKKKEQWNTDEKISKAATKQVAALNEQLTRIHELVGYTKTLQGIIYNPDTSPDAKTRAQEMQNKVFKTLITKYNIASPLDLYDKLITPPKVRKGATSTTTAEESDAEKKARERTVKSGLSFEEKLADMSDKLRKDASRARIAELKSRGRDEEAALLELNENKLDIEAEYNTRLRELMYTFRMKYPNLKAEEVKKLPDYVKQEQLIIDTAFNKLLSTQQEYNNKKVTEVEKTEDKIHKILLSGENLVSKERTALLRAQGKIGRFWNADVEKIEEEKANKLIEIERWKTEELRKINKEYEGLTDDTAKNKALDSVAQQALERIQIAEDLSEALQHLAIYGKTAWDGFLDGLLEAQKGMGTLGDNIQKLTTGVISKFTSDATDAFVAWTDGSKNAKEAFRDFTESFIREVHRQVTQLLVLYMVKKMVGLISSAFSSTGGDYTGMGSTSYDGISEATGGAMQTIDWTSMGATDYVTRAKGGILPHIASFRKFSTGGITGSPTLALLGDNASKKELVIPSENITEGRVSGYTRDKQEGSGEKAIINLFDKELVPAILAEYPGSVLNIVSADVMKRGITYSMIKSVNK